MSRRIPRRAEVAARILAMRRRGLSWKVIMRRTGYGRTRCHMLAKEALEAEAAAELKCS